MAGFDRAYVPALSLTAGKDTTGQSVLAVKRLKQDWDILSAKHAQVFAIGGAGGKINAILERADMLVSTGDFKGAHSELEALGNVLLDARRRHGIDYFMDYLISFCSVMEDAVSDRDGRDPAAITEGDMRTLAGQIPGVRVRWNAVAEAPFDRKAFLFDKQTEAALRDAVAQEAKAIDNLEAALRSGNRKLVMKHILLLKEGYASVFRMFGNFESVSI
jgi:hypothetical protein